MKNSMGIREECTYYYIGLNTKSGRVIFQEDEDFQEYLRLIKNYTLRFGLHLICFLLLPAEIHLLLKPSLESDTSSFIHLISFQYRDMLEDEPRIILVERGPYLLELSCYLHLKPVRTNMVERAQDYPFSSYHIYIGKNNGSVLNVECNEIMEQISSKKEEGRDLYQQFVESGYFGRQEFWKMKLKESIIGSREFIDRVKERQSMLSSAGGPKILALCEA